MTATLGETYATADTRTAAAETGLLEARRLSPRRARRELTAQVAHSPAGHRVVAAMIGVLAIVALAGALVQVVAG